MEHNVLLRNVATERDIVGLTFAKHENGCMMLLLTGVSNIDNVYAGNQHIMQQEGPRALDRSPETWHIRWCFVQLWLRRYHLKIFLFLALVAAEQNILINFGRRHNEEHFFEIYLNLDQLLRRKGLLKRFLNYSSGGLFVQCFQTICAIMVVVFMRNISVKLSRIWNSASRLIWNAV